MKKFDELGMALCQSEYKGSQCDGHEGHYQGEEWPHFATVTDGVMTWTDEGKSEQGTAEEMIHKQISRCCK